MPTVGVGRRAVAIIIDSLLLVLPAAPVIAHAVSTTSDFLSDTTPPTQQSVDAANASFGWVNTTLAVLVILWLVYMIVMENAYGASIGKFALGIRVVRLDGQPMDGFTSFLRNIIRAVDWLFFYLVGAIIIWNSPLHQRLGDKAAKTIVVPAAFAETYRGEAELPPVPAASGLLIPPRPDR